MDGQNFKPDSLGSITEISVTPEAPKTPDEEQASLVVVADKMQADVDEERKKIGASIEALKDSMEDSQISANPVVMAEVANSIQQLTNTLNTFEPQQETLPPLPLKQLPPLPPLPRQLPPLPPLPRQLPPVPRQAPPPPPSQPETVAQIPVVVQEALPPPPRQLPPVPRRLPPVPHQTPPPPPSQPETVAQIPVVVEVPAVVTVEAPDVTELVYPPLPGTPGGRELTISEQRNRHSNFSTLSLDEQISIFMDFSTLPLNEQEALREAFAALPKEKRDNINKGKKEAARMADRQRYTPRVENRVERDVQSPDELSAREYSKKHRKEERSRLAAEIMAERIRGREEMAALKLRAEQLATAQKEGVEATNEDAKKLEELQNLRVTQSNLLMAHLKTFSTIAYEGDIDLEKKIIALDEAVNSGKQKTEEIARDLEETMKALVDLDETLKNLPQKIQQKLDAHYENSAERMRSTVEQTILRNNVFFCHAFGFMSGNANSEVNIANSSESNSFAEGAMDGILALEPSLAVSSIMLGKDDKGRRDQLTGYQGLILGGGDIELAFEGDAGTRMLGIKDRRDRSENRHFSVNTEAIDKIARTRTGGAEKNEYVVNNAQVFGYFESINKRDGAFKIDDVDTMRAKLQKVNDRGIPFYAKDDENRMFEIFTIYYDGSLEIGAELTPQEVAKGKAGLAPEVRKKIGSELLQKRDLYKNNEVGRKMRIEATAIVDAL